MTSPTCSRAGGNRPGRLTLAVSFSGPGGSLALASPEWVEAVDWGEKATASELATLKLEEILSRRGNRLADLDRLVVNVGPGSFTGIRVGVNLARTLAYALDRPIAAVDTLSVLARKNLSPGQTGLLALKAVQTHYYAAAFRRHDRDLETTMPARSLTRTELDRHRATKVLVEGEADGFDPRVTAPDLLDFARDLPELTRFFSWREINPLYVRGSEAEEKLKKGLLKHS